MYIDKLSYRLYVEVFKHSLYRYVRVLEEEIKLIKNRDAIIFKDKAHRKDFIKVLLKHIAYEEIDTVDKLVSLVPISKSYIVIDALESFKDYLEISCKGIVNYTNYEIKNMSLTMINNLIDKLDRGK